MDVRLKKAATFSRWKGCESSCRMTGEIMREKARPLPKTTRETTKRAYCVGRQVRTQVRAEDADGGRTP